MTISAKGKVYKGPHEIKKGYLHTIPKSKTEPKLKNSKTKKLKVIKRVQTYTNWIQNQKRTVSQDPKKYFYQKKH